MLDYDERIRDNDMAHIVNLDERLTNINDSHIEYKKGDIMKKIFFVALLIALLIVVTGCQNPFKPNNNKVTGGLELTNNNVFVAPENLIEDYNKAMDDYTGRSTDPIALLGTQVVAGTNYMFLSERTNKGVKSLYMTTIYKDLEGKVSVLGIKDFDLTKYANTDIDYVDEELMGGWQTFYDSSLETDIEEGALSVFNVATRDYKSNYTYKPVALLAKQVVAGTNYIMLAVASSKDENPTQYYTILTIYEDLKSNDSVISEAYLDLSRYNEK